MLPFDIINDTLLGDYRVFTLHRQLLQHPTQDSSHPFFVVKTTDWVNVLAITPEQDVVLVRQPRAGTASVTVEIPGGMVDPDEAPITAAARELREETGYTSDPLIPLGVVEPNPALFSNRCHTFLAPNARYEGTQRLDEAEVIEVFTQPLAGINGLLSDGTITHALVHAAFAHYDRLKSRIATN
jgi:8-oxo-dGTP pyrophosphatase MutT (NUDIX family)